MTGTVVGVLRGGPSREHEVSLQTGAAMLQNLPADEYVVRDIYIDKAGQWHDRGRPTTPHQVLRTIDVVLLGLHGEYGEDGEVQKILDQAGVPYAGSGAMSSYLAMHKALAKQHARDAGLLVAKDVFIERTQDIVPGVKQAMQFMQPIVIKPVRWGSSVGVSITHGFEPAVNAVIELFDAGANGVLIEELIKGTEATAGVVENLRGERLYSLPIVEIVPPEKDFFSFDAKYSGAAREIVPGRFPKKVADELARQARVMHETLGLRHYSRSDFIVSSKGIYFLETNTLPGLTAESLFPKSLAAVGIKLTDFLHHLVNLAMHV